MKKNVTKPPWLKVKAFQGQSYDEVNRLLRGAGLNTVCQAANCPNRGECFNRGTATFMILGSICTRGCRFCNVAGGIPEKVDPNEPLKVARAAKSLKLKYIVVTSVTRDDLADGGAGQFADVILALRKELPDSKVEVLTPDFKNKAGAVEKVVEARPYVYNHNLETVKRLYTQVRPGADYQLSLKLLKKVTDLSTILTKSGIMVGLGETTDELKELFDDLAVHKVSSLTIGQYLSPSPNHLPIEKFYHPDEFEQLKETAISCGIPIVFSGPLVRSSYMADQINGHL